jgi:hypothetical protein
MIDLRIGAEEDDGGVSIAANEGRVGAISDRGPV